ncbi:TPA: peptide ABC transporter substrate-binding protein [Bacillus cereus]|nr:peptide ABC transporter substrate-binding protein [Bacillus cereus]
MFKKVTSVVASVLCASFLVTACSSGEKETKNTAKATDKNEAKQSINLPYIAEIPTMDVTKATDSESMNVMRNVFEGLYTLGESNKLIPGVAQSYDVSEDKKTYTFHLRESKWSNGTPVTAEDFVFAWKRAVNPDTAAEYSFLFFDIKNAKKINSKELTLDQLGVKAVDNKILEVQLEHPVPYFINLTTFPTFLPINEKYFESKGKRYGLEADQLIYNGAVTLDSWKHDWKKAKQELGKEEVTLELLTSDNALAKRNAEYLKGDLEKNLDGLIVNIKAQPRKQQIQLLLNSEYEIGVDVWEPDIPDPITFLDLFTTDSTYNFDKYSNKEYDELIHKIKGDLAGDEKARWEAMKKAEKILLDDGAVAPFYQQGRSYLQRSSIKGIVTNDFGAEFNYKWAEIDNK